MTTVRNMLPPVAQPYTEVVVGAALGALVGGYVLRQKTSTGALVGAIAGYGLMLSKGEGVFPFRASGGAYVGDSVTQFPGVPGATGADGRYGNLVMPGSDAAAQILDNEEAFTQPAQPEWPHHFEGWGRGASPNGSWGRGQGYYRPHGFGRSVGRYRR